MEIDFVEMFFFERSGTVNVRKLALQVGNDRLNELLTVLSHLQGIVKVILKAGWAFIWAHRVKSWTSK